MLSCRHRADSDLPTIDLLQKSILVPVDMSSCTTQRFAKPILMKSNGFRRAGQFISIIFTTILLVGSAYAQTIYSVNALGYVDVNFQTGSNFVANPLLNPDSTVSNLFRSVPDGSFLQIWDRATESFGPTNYFTAASGWSDPNAVLIQPKGALLWLTALKTISFVGEVFQGFLTNIYYPAGLWVLGAIPGQFTTCADFTQCPQSPPDQTVFNKWDPALHRFTHYTWFGFGPGDPNSGWYNDFFDKVDVRLEHGEAGVFSVPSSFNLPSIQPHSRVFLREARHDGTNFTFRFSTDGNTPYTLLCATNLPPDYWEIVREGNATNGMTTVTHSNTSDGLAFYRVGPGSGGSANPILFNPAREPGQFRFEFLAPTNGTYLVERSAALNYPGIWQSIRTNTISGKAVVRVTDTNATAAANYYRVRLN